MDVEIEIKINPKEIINAISKMKKAEQEDFLEELLASVSPEYLDSIREARADYKAGRFKDHKELFG